MTQTVKTKTSDQLRKTKVINNKTLNINALKNIKAKLFYYIY